ncbi:hypothetical protein BCR33DRAFT_712377 [Rhizoclosmatium globosum]|uniref:Uncharacterized protein n=1 Tax=Rhizoclosmatium globosum TaxID=329046 RepID=A0A1Y2CWQ8_9FUNG|nr:hypothetical protein BCR33DRAFT_712377 [Rhizoclosmatium globosum]|eukprot:ORY51274.1 hypothetical protein BCR33DRAFT_712377 [Rhizoclosmatium globosum]
MSTESHFVLSGKVALALEPKLQDPSFVLGLQTLTQSMHSKTFVGREHIDALSTKASTNLLKRVKVCLNRLLKAHIPISGDESSTFKLHPKY